VQGLPPAAKLSDKPKFMRIAVYQPDIPHNLGAMIRLGACLDVPVDVIEPCGFPFGGIDKDVKGVRRAGMDYMKMGEIERHISWSSYRAAQRQAGGRLILLTTTAQISYLDIAYAADDTLLVGRESAGAPAEVHSAADIEVRIVMTPPARSLNVVNAAAMVLGEALRQIGPAPG
jgi:tRNA (cytidine/uridine-2'-O-)-methyltransferase